MTLTVEAFMEIGLLFAGTLLVVFLVGMFLLWLIGGAPLPGDRNREEHR